MLSAAAALVDHIEPDRHLQVEALALACHLDHPVGDCLDLALARREAAVLLTTDQKLMALPPQVLPLLVIASVFVACGSRKEARHDRVSIGLSL